jgi:hypothetical protein
VQYKYVKKCLTLEQLGLGICCGRLNALWWSRRGKREKCVLELREYGKSNFKVLASW